MSKHVYVEGGDGDMKIFLHLYCPEQEVGLGVVIEIYCTFFYFPSKRVRYLPSVY